MFPSPVAIMYYGNYNLTTIIFVPRNYFMSKAGRAKRKQAEARKARSLAQQQSQRYRMSKWLRSLKIVRRGAWAIWVVVIAIVALLANLAQIYFSAWRMSVTPGEARNQSDPFSTMFVFHNEGQFPMHDITFSCKAHAIGYDSGVQINSKCGT